jgi:phosphoglycerol transferase MdoB-like AlkP superfamily enzyme
MTNKTITNIDFAPDKSKSITNAVNKCFHCGGTNHISLYTEDVDKYKNGAFIQEAFSYLNAQERELIKTGIHEACWDAMCGEDS